MLVLFGGESGQYWIQRMRPVACLCLPLLKVSIARGGVEDEHVGHESGIFKVEGLQSPGTDYEKLKLFIIARPLIPQTSRLVHVGGRDKIPTLSRVIESSAVPRLSRLSPNITFDPIAFFIESSINRL
jgi:hypothetical protein